MSSAEEHCRMLAYGHGWCFMALKLTDRAPQASAEGRRQSLLPLRRQVNVYARRYSQEAGPGERAEGSRNGVGRSFRAAPAGGEPDSMDPGDETPPGSSQSGDHLCPRCSGSGRIDDAPCPACDGTGRVTAIVGDA